MTGPPRKLKLSPVEGKILSMLREAHEEDLSALANEVARGGEDVRPQLRRALEHLLDLGLVEFGEYRGHPREFHCLDRGLLNRVLAEGGPLEWNEEHEVWLWHPSLVDRTGEVTLVLTESGAHSLKS